MSALYKCLHKVYFTFKFIKITFFCRSNNAQTTIGLKFDDLCQKVDYLCDGDDKDQEEALQLLQNYKYLVKIFIVTL